jgi:putative ABC transport system substrate-binding protein
VSGLTRRRFVHGAGVAGLGLLAGCGRLPGQAAPRIPRIGYLSLAGPPASRPAPFEQGLHDFGYVVEQNVVVEWRFAEFRAEALPALAAELVNLGVDILVTQATPAALAAKNATSMTAVVIASAADPVEAGLVVSLARPGGNVTGVSEMAPQLSGKRLELLKEMVPGLARVTTLWVPGDVGSVMAWKELQEPAHTLGLTLLPIEIRGPDDVSSALEAATRDSAEAIMVLPSPILHALRGAQIADFALQQRLPTMGANPSLVQAGGLMTYSVNFAALHRRAAYYVDRILKGARPADLPVEQPTRFDFVINLKTAQAIGLTIPQHVLLQATEVIQ